MKKIVIRADGSKKIGFGHLSRMAVLAGELVKLDYDLLFITTVLDENIESFFDDRDLKFISFSPPSIEKAVLKHHQIMKDFGANLTILDSYFVNDEYRKGLKEHGVKVVAVDDVYKHYSYADFVINHNPSADISRYDNFGGKILAGVSYALINNDFAKIGTNQKNEIPNILVMMGGSDAVNQTDRVVKILDEIDADFSITALQGFYSDKSNPTETKHKCDFVHGTYNVPLVFEQCDACITAGGVSTIELASAGIPFMTLLTNYRQLDNANAWERLGASVYGGDTEKISDDELKVSLKRFTSMQDEWESMGLKGRELVDGKGAERVAKRLAEFDKR